MADNTLAKLAIEFEAKLDKLKSEFAQAKAEAVKAGQEVGDSFAQGVAPGVEKAKVATAGFGDQVKATAKEVSAFRSVTSQLAGAAGSAAAAMQAVITVMEYVDQVFGDGTESAREFIGTLSTDFTKDAGRNLDSLRQKIQGVEAELAKKLESNWLTSIAGRSLGTITDELEELRHSAAGISELAENRKRMASEAAAIENRQTEDMERRADLHKELGALQSAAIAGTDAELKAEERITKTLEDRKDIIKELREALPDEMGFQKELDRVEKVFEGIAERAGKKLADEAAKGIKKAAEEAAKLMGAQASAAVSAMRNQFDQMASSVGRLVEIAESQRLNGKH